VDERVTPRRPKSLFSSPTSAGRLELCSESADELLVAGGSHAVTVLLG
jgi:hypothetical protein